MTGAASLLPTICQIGYTTCYPVTNKDYMDMHASKAEHLQLPASHNGVTRRAILGMPNC